MINLSNRKNIYEKLSQALRSFATLSLIWLFFMLLLSVVEILFYKTGNTLPTGIFKLMGSSWSVDLQFWFGWLFPMALLYVPFFLLRPKLANIMASVMIVLFFCIHLVLVSYFSSSLVILGADLFGYSYEDIVLTVGASGSVGMGSVLIFSGIVLCIALTLVYLTKKLRPSIYISTGLPMVSLLFIIFGVAEAIGKPNVNSDFANTIVTNKSEHFYNAVHSYYFDVGYEVDIYADDYLSEDKAFEGLVNFNYLSNAYPFLHTKIQDDVLSPYFEPMDKAPNIVIILVEGLGRAFTNEGAYLGNFTPFLDSLSNQSLYWKNFLSNGGRTFAVLPAVLGSLPFAGNGFMEMGNKMPKHLSLLNLLQNNGYETSFYYGGDSGFDNMAAYLDFNTIDNICDEKTFQANHKKLPSNNGFTWGYGDGEIYSHYLNNQTNDPGANPHLSVILTVATHSPFLLNDANKYAQLFETRMDHLQFDEATKEKYKNYADQYSTILYADEALKDFFEAYKKRPGYQNTIFVITGDHRIPEIPMSTKMDRYHVPLIIYSPLLKRNAEIASVSSHFDIAPSLVNYLKNNHDIKAPAVESWLGQGLDTTRAFQNRHATPLMQTKTDIIDFVMGEYHLNGDVLFKIDKNMGEDVVNNPKIKEQMMRAFRAFKIKNRQIINGARMIPDSIYRNYTINN